MKLRAALTNLLIGAATGAMAQSPKPFADAACPEYDQFVQEYEVTGEMLGGRAMTPCPGSNLSGPQLFPQEHILVRIEYLQGDYFVVQERREWHVEPGPECMQITPRLVREYRRREGRDEEQAWFGDGQARRTRDGDDPGNSLVAGTAQARQPPPRALEQTPFGVNCGRIDSSVTPGLLPGSSLCKVYLPKRCRSELYMAPIELTAPMPGAPMRGRTRSLVIGSEAGVDVSQWVVP